MSIIIKTTLRERYRDESGMTLAELISGMGIAAILLTVVGGLLVSTGRLTAFQTEQTLCQRKLEAVSSIIEKQVRYADQLKISRNSSIREDFQHTICFNTDGKIFLDGTEIFSDDGPYRYFLFVENCGKKEHSFLLEFTVRLVDRENQTLSSIDNVVKLVNLDLAEGTKSIIYPEEETEGTGYNSQKSDLCLLYHINGWEDRIDGIGSGDDTDENRRDFAE